MDIRHKLGVTEGWTQMPSLAWEPFAGPDSFGTAWMLSGLEVNCSLLLVAARLDPAVLCTTAVFAQTQHPVWVIRDRQALVYLPHAYGVRGLEQDSSVGNISAHF